MAAACVDHFSGGRFILGLGSSHKVQVEPEHGLTFSQPVQRLRESMEIIRLLLRDGTVTYKGSVFNIDSFDFWFEPLRRTIPIYVAAVFPKMLEICGEISDGAMLTWCTLEHARNAANHVAMGASRVGKKPEEVDLATLLPCTVSANRAEALNSMRPSIANYAAYFPRYRRLMEEAGFTEELKAVAQAWKEEDKDLALQLVPTELIEKIALVGTPDYCRQKVQDYRDAGITLPIISPRVTGKDAKRQAMDVISSCAPL